MQERAANDDRGQGSRAWPRAAEGVQLVGIASFLLLNTTGYLPWSFWLEAVSLWPLLIVSFGIHIAFEKSRAPWLVLLGPAIVLGGLVWLASGGRSSLPDGPWRTESAARPDGVTRVEVDLRLAATRVRLAATADLPAGQLVEGRSLHGRSGSRLETAKEGETAQVRLLGGSGTGIVFLPRPRDSWDLRLARDLPLSLNLKAAGVGGRFDLTASIFEGAHAEGVFLGLEARLPAPPRDTEISMNGVFNSLIVAVPAGTPVRVHGQGLPFNAVASGLPGTPGRPGYDVHVKGIFSAVETVVDPAIDPGPPAGR